MKKIAFSLLSIIMLVAMALPAASIAVLAGGGDVANLTAGQENTTPLDYIVISPDNASINGGGEETQAYTAEAFDAQEKSLGNVTRDTNFTIEPEAGGSWEGCIYTSEHVGDWVVTGTHITGKTDTAILQVLETPEYPGGSFVSPDQPGANRGTETPAKSTPVLTSQTNGTPRLEVDKTVSPESICIDDQATVTLTVTGAGEPAEEHLPLDVVLIIDRSGSMSGTPLDDAKAAAKTFVGLLNSTSDRSGLVSFSYWNRTTYPWSWEARLNQNLTFDQSATNSSITSLTAFGNTAIGEGIYTANAELINYGRNQTSTIYAEVLLSDGNWNTGRNPIGAAQEAANNTIIIYTIGLGDADNTTMWNIANITGGKYYYAPNSTDLEGIYQEIAEELSNIAGTNVVVTEVLPDDVNYINGTAVPTPDSTSGQNLTWELGTIVINETETITFNVTFNYTGYQPVDVYPDTRVNYTDY